MPQIPQNMRIVLLFKTYGCFNHLQMPVNVHCGVQSIWDALRERKPGLKKSWRMRNQESQRGMIIANWPKGCSLAWQEMGEP